MIFHKKNKQNKSVNRNKKKNTDKYNLIHETSPKAISSNPQKNNTVKQQINTYNSKDNNDSILKSKNNIIKINSEFFSQNFIHVKKLKNIFIVILTIFILLVVRIGFLQFVNGSSLKKMAYNQQAINQIISPKRGNILDSTGKVLATSAKVDTITINPNNIKDSKDDEQKTKELKEKVAKGLSDIFALDYNETLEKVNSKSQVQTIAKKVEQNKVDELKNWMKENDISVGINIDEDSKRYYPYNNVLSHVLGFCGNDNDGRYGIEYKWDSILTGTPGKIVSSKDSSQKEIPNAEESYIAPENGSNLILTVDLNVQTVVEKYLKQACIDNMCTRGGSCIVMNPKNGDILAMANYPDFDLNNPNTPTYSYATNYDKLSTEEKSNVLFTMWKNKSISDLYEPGSVFKLITASVAIEENITTPDVQGDFYCKGYEEFKDSSSVRTIKCWNTNHPHGSQSLRSALGNSCNPAFMQLAARIGTPTLYKYYKSYGLFNTTNIDLPGESNSIFTTQEDVGPVELATAAFGQRTVNITPLQMITAVSAIANDGVLVQPRVVKQIENTDTGAITNIETVEVRQVLSSETAKTMKSMMESVVITGTGKNAAVTGYSVGGKSGTSEPIESNKENGYVASFLAISPVEDTQVVILLALYDPTNPERGHQGGTIAGPVVSQILTEILPYLGIPSDEDTSSNSEDNLITVLDIRNKTITEAEKILKDAGFTTKISTKNDKNNTIVTDQVPKPGIALSKNSVVLLYDDDNAVRTSVTVPDLTGKSRYEATNILKTLNLNVTFNGSGTVVSQDPAKDTKVEEGSVIKVNLKSSSNNLH